VRTGTKHDSLRRRLQESELWLDDWLPHRLQVFSMSAHLVSDGSLAAKQTHPGHLPRLPREYYQGDAFIHWTLSTHDRATGWLAEEFHLRFRELLLHAAAREGLFCPAYCLMPDHLHLVWMGLRLDSDQLNGMAFLRTYLESRVQRPLMNFSLARFSSRSASRCLISSRLSNSCLPLPTASDTFTLPFFQ